MNEDPTPTVCNVDTSLLNDPARLRERALAIDAWKAGKPVDKFVDGKWSQIETQSVFFYDARYRARLPDAVSNPVKRYDQSEDRNIRETPDGGYVLFADYDRDTKALEADKARLDLLEKWLNETDYVVELRRYAPGQYWIETDKWEGQNGTNLREAIDGVTAP